MDIKNKVIIAYEPESSQTLRLTPEDIGKLLFSMNTKDFIKALRVKKEELKHFYPAVQSNKILTIQKCIDELEKTL